LSVFLALAIVATAALASTAEPRDDKEPVYRGQPLSAWVEDLKSGDRATRWVALAAIAEMGPKAEKAVGPVARLLASPVAGDREHAAEALGQIGPEAREAVPALEKLLGDADSQVAKAAGVAMERIGPPFKKIVPDLLKATQHPSAKTRLWAAEELGRLGPDAKEATVRLTKSAANDGVTAVRVAAVKALTRINPKESLPFLSEMLEENNPIYSQWAAVQLGGLGAEANECVRALVAMATGDLDADVRGAAETAVLRINPKNARTAFTQALQEKYPRKRHFAATALGRIGTDARDAAEPLARLVRGEPDARVRRAAAAALTRIDSREAQSTFFQMIQDSDVAKRRWAAARLVYLGPVAKEAAAPLARLARADADLQVRLAAAVSLAGIDPTNEALVVAELAKSLARDRGDNAALAAAALLRMGPAARGAIPELVEAMKSNDLLVSMCAAGALGRIGEAAVVPLTKVMEGGADSVVIGKAAYALSQIGPNAKESVTALRKLCTKRDSLTRIAAAYALARVSPAYREQAVATLKNEIGRGTLPKDISPSDSAVMVLTWLHVEQSKETVSRWARLLAAEAPSGGFFPDFWGTLWTEFSRVYGAYGLAVLGRDAETAVGKLRESLKDSDPLVRTLAAYALAQASSEIKDQKAANETLKMIQKDGNRLAELPIERLVLEAERKDRKGPVGTPNAAAREYTSAQASLQAAFLQGFPQRLLGHGDADTQATVWRVLCDALAQTEPGNRFPTSYVLKWFSTYAEALMRGDELLFEAEASLHHGLAAEALRRIEAMPERKPGEP
jgi:HEAT repeat protein